MADDPTYVACPECERMTIPLPPFDAEAARALRPRKVRKRWPRKRETCPFPCGASLVVYASFEHYIAGDW